MSYGLQLNIFKAGSNRYGPDWQGCIAVRNKHELLIAADDALEALGGRLNKAEQVLYLPTGARLRFFIVEFPLHSDQAFKGRQYTQIVWLHRPTGAYADDIIDAARAALRSSVVPTVELRYEYLNVK